MAGNPARFAVNGRFFNQKMRLYVIRLHDVRRNALDQLAELAQYARIESEAFRNHVHRNAPFSYRIDKLVRRFAPATHTTVKRGNRKRDTRQPRLFRKTLEALAEIQNAFRRAVDGGGFEKEQDPHRIQA